MAGTATKEEQIKELEEKIAKAKTDEEKTRLQAELRKLKRPQQTFLDECAG